MAKRKKKEAASATTTVEASVSEAAQAAAVETQRPSEIVDEEAASSAATSQRRYSVDFHTPQSKAHDNVAGVRLLKFDKFKQFQLQLPEDAPQEIAVQLQEKGWTFRPAEGVFTKQYGDQGAGPLYVEARRLFQQLCEQLAPAGHSQSF